MPAITDISQLDLNGTYSYADYLTWKFEQTLELIKGKIFLPMAALSRRHQQISWRLTLQIGELFKHHRCDVYAAPFDVRLYDKKKSEKANKETVMSLVFPDLAIHLEELFLP